MKQTVRYKNEYTLSYAEFGDKKGFPILIQHGLIASIDDYDLFEGLIKSGSRVICIARPGYGESSPYEMKHVGEWADIISVLNDELGLTQFDVLGMSSGAPYGYAIGYRFPDQVRNIFILSGTPALYDDNILSFWPHPVNKHACIADMQKLAYDIFFSNLPQEDQKNNAVRDSMMNHCFGIALDLKIRCLDWGFQLPDVKANVTMRHSKADASVPFITAEMTSKLLPNCRFDIREIDPHFSNEVLDDFIKTAITIKMP